MPRTSVIHLAPVGLEAGGERDGSGVRAATPEGRDLGRMDVARRRAGVERRERRDAHALEAGDDHDLARGQLGADPARVDARDPGPAVAAIGRDAGLGPREADRGHAQRLERHRHQGRALVLAGGQQHVQLPGIGVIGDRRRERQQLVGRVAHGGHDDHQLGAVGPLANDPSGHPPDPLRVGERGAAELHDDEGAGHAAHSSRAGLRTRCPVSMHRRSRPASAPRRWDGFGWARHNRRLRPSSPCWRARPMCFDHDSRPPIPPIAGGALDTADVELEAADGNRFAAYLARAAEPNGAGIVILPDVRGLHAYYRDLALRFAEHGIEAIAIDYFGRTAGIGDRGPGFEFAAPRRPRRWPGCAPTPLRPRPAARGDRRDAGVHDRLLLRRPGGVPERRVRARPGRRDRLLRLAGGRLAQRHAGPGRRRGHAPEPRAGACSAAPTRGSRPRP